MTNEPEKVVIELTSEGEIFAQGSFDALNRLHALIGESEKLRKDAARYRWLRSHDRVSDKHEDGMGPPGTVGMVFISQGDGYAEAEGGDDLDAAIDSAMQGANHDNQ